MKVSELPLIALHLDYHIPELSSPGFNLYTKEKYLEALRASNAEMAIIFAKDHFGNCFYNTRHGHEHRDLRGDILADAISFLKPAGKKVFAYYSLCWEKWSGDHNPDWQQRKEDGTLLSDGWAWNIVCPNSPYLEETVLPQLQEIVSGYDVDGVFLDIAMYNHGACFCEYCKKRYWREYGRELTPGSGQKQFAAESMCHALRMIRERIKLKKPECLLCANASWEMGQPQELDGITDFSVVESQPAHVASGGYLLQMLQSKFCHAEERAFQIITVRFNADWGELTLKPAAQLCYEFALIAANGGKISCGDQGDYDGLLQLNVHHRLGQAFSWLKQRESLFLHARSRRHLAVLYNYPSNFPYSLEQIPMPLLGFGKMLAELHRQFEPVSERRLLENITCYQAVIIPSGQKISITLQAALEDYVRGGGKLYLEYDAGFDAEQHFLFDSLLPLHGYGPACYDFGYLATPGDKTQLELAAASFIRLENDPKITSLYHMHYPITVSRPPYRGWRSSFPPPHPENYSPGIVAETVGQGMIVYSAVPLAETYWKKNHYWLKNIVAEILRRMVPDTPFEITGGTNIDANLTDNDRGETMLHLLHCCTGKNAGGGYPYMESCDMAEFAVKIASPTRPKQLRLAPGGQELPFSYENGQVSCKVKTNEIHTTLVLKT